MKRSETLLACLLGLTVFVGGCAQPQAAPVEELEPEPQVPYPGPIIDISTGGNGSLTYRVEETVISGPPSSPYKVDPDFLRMVSRIALVDHEATPPVAHYLSTQRLLKVTFNTNADPTKKEYYVVKRGALSEVLEWTCHVLESGTLVAHDLIAGSRGDVPNCLRGSPTRPVESIAFSHDAAKKGTFVMISTDL
jgi:hypothetical protein